MKIVDQEVRFEHPIDGRNILRAIEVAARNCYKSENNNAEGNHDKTEDFVRGVIKRGHHSVLEHQSITVRFICNRGVTHELVRHRIGVAYSQESTRYCNYGAERFGNEITVIRPHWWNSPDVMSLKARQASWIRAMKSCEKEYFIQLYLKAPPQDARGVLPIDLKTEIVVTMNLRAWRHFFFLRAAKAAHPQIRALARQLLANMWLNVPVVFNNLHTKYFLPDSDVASETQP